MKQRDAMFAAGSCGDAQLQAADCSQRRLVRRLCASVLDAEGQGCQGEQGSDEARLRALEDTAHAVLLGFEGDVPYVPPDERPAQAAAGIADAAQQLRAEGYPGLAADLEAGAEQLKRAPAFPLLGSLLEAETGAPLVLPLTEQPALLAFLLALKGSRPSLRQRLFTFQSEGGTTLFASPGDPAAAALGAAAGGAAGPAAGVATPDQQQEARVPLASSVFEEAPNPQLLSDGSATVAVLLPRELGLPTDAFAGLEALQDLGAGLASRPVWAPTAAGAALPAPREPSWLPLPAALRELRGDARRGAVPAPLGLSLSLLSMDDEPGSSTVFSGGAAAWDGASDGDAASADSVQPQGSPGRGAAAAAAAAERQLGGPSQLWTLAEAELARHALLALQGVAASLLRLQALLAAPGALPRRSISGLLQKLAEAAELRLRLQRFVTAFSEGGAAAGAAQPCSNDGSEGCEGGGSGQDPVQQAFAAAVADVLQRQSAAIQQLEQEEGSPWVQAVEVAGSHGWRLFGRGPSLLQVALHTGRLQLQLRSLADLCWCGLSPAADGSPMAEDALPAQAAVGGEDGSAAEEAQRAQQGQKAQQQQQLGSTGPCLWEEGSFPAGVQLLNYLFERANEADDADAPVLRFLFVQAMQPYLRHMHVWAFTTHAVSPEFGTAGDKELLTLDFLPPPPAEEAPGREPPVALVPVDPPSFLQPLHAAFMRAGSQLRLLHSLEQQGRRLAQQLADIAEAEVRQRQAAGTAGTAGTAAAGGVLDAGSGSWAPWHSVTSFAALPGELASAAGPSAAHEPWLALGGGAAGAAGSLGSSGDTPLGCQDLQLSSGGLQRAVQITGEQDAARVAAVSSWLAAMALQRRLAEHAVVAQQLGRAAAQRDQQAQQAAQRVAALSRRTSAKSQLFAEQQAAVAERRAQRAAQQAQQEAEDRLAGGSAFDWPGLQTASAGGAAAVAATLSAAAAAAEEEGDGGDALAPLSAVIEAAVSQSVLSQYRAVSRACVRLFLDELKVLEHLEALRRFFFQGAGDWADAVVGQLGAHADSLLPLAAHQADAMLADAGRGTSVDGDPYASHLRLRLLPESTSAINAQVSAIAIATPQRRARSFWSSKLTVQLAPTQLDALDCIALDYQDTLQGYTAVFCAMTRVRRVAQLLRALHKPLGSQPRSTADLLLSEEDADKAHRRIQRLRAFHFGASQFVGALQAFLHARTAGDAWVHLLAKLMVSSEEVAASLIARQPSAPMTGLLSRMNSLGPTGKAAHKLAQHLTRALSASRPGSPTAAAGGGGSGQFARFNSLLSAASGASSAAASPRAAHAGRAPQLSRLGSQAALPNGRSAALSRQQSGAAGLASAAGSPTAATAAATAGGGLSRQGSLASVLQAAAGEQQAGSTGALEPDAAAWARHFQQSQQGISDLQELLDLHRRYVRQASQDCLTWGGSEAARCAVEGALQCLLGFAFRLQAAVRSGAGRRPQDTWTQALRLDDAWRPLAEAMHEFEERALQLQDVLRDAGASSPLAELQLDFNGYLQRRRQERQRQEAQQQQRQQQQPAARSLASVNSAFAGTGVVARAAARRAAAARVNVQASFFKTSTATKPSKSVGNAKKASKLSSGVVLTAGEDIKATQFTADLGFTKKRIALGFTKSNELFVGRAAMLGVAFAIVGEILTGAGPLAQLGYELHESVFDVEVEILAVIAFNLLAAFLPAKGRFVADEEELEERPKGPLQDPRISILEPKKFFGISGFGQFSKENELFVGRVAQLGFASALIGEAITGKGILGQLGLETGLPLNETEPLLLAFVAFTLFAAINPGSGKFVDEK
ncbi:hypothetical protein COHA_007604 [Chlorella ohadii]|uniref:Gamma tubulin complex component C-terminal domain-containing protein n=1 Tax=Chlorella ohadii TaxID=2649997 RepID=A0AAD5GZN8_9CHLO|nr:hypothetical protein COHA_007604 [Chlorella ohadii]